MEHENLSNNVSDVMTRSKTLLLSAKIGKLTAPGPHNLYQT